MGRRKQVTAEQPVRISPEAQRTLGQVQPLLVLLAPELAQAVGRCLDAYVASLGLDPRGRYALYSDGTVERLPDEPATSIG